MTQPADLHLRFLERAIDLASRNVAAGTGGPFGAVVVRNGEVVAEGANHVTTTNDPTAHAEIVAIRAACAVLGSFQLEECTVYCSCEPCPMCLGALYWARPDAVFYAATASDAAAAGFDDRFIYEEIAVPPSARSLTMTRLDASGAKAPFDRWAESAARTDY